MPIHTSPISRRTFLANSAAGIASLAVLQQGWGAELESNPNLFALLSDTHIPNSPDVSAHGTNMTSNLKQVVGELTALKTKPAGVIINGDCAYLKGLPADYKNLSQCVAPLSEAGLPLHLNMGNHDDRRPLYDALASQEPSRPLVESKHVSLIETPHVNWFLLDSLTEVNVVTGELGEAQRAWLAKALDAHQDKPAIIVAHHTPQFTAPAEGARWTGLKDTAELLDLIMDRKHVKAYIYGHSHNWSLSKQNDIHFVNLPPVGYIFALGKPNGWVQAEIHADGIRLELKTIHADHPRNKERVDLAWR